MAISLSLCSQSPHGGDLRAHAMLSRRGVGLAGSATRPPAASCGEGGQVGDEPGPMAGAPRCRSRAVQHAKMEFLVKL